MYTQLVKVLVDVMNMDIINQIATFGDARVPAIAANEFGTLIKAVAKYAKGHHKGCSWHTFSDDKRHCSCGYDELVALIAPIVQALDQDRQR